MNQTGVRSTCSRRSARTRRGSDTGPRLAPEMQAVPAHPVPAGPLAVRWLFHEVEELQAGVVGRAKVDLENAGEAQWRDVYASYHWLDDLGNPIHWDGLRTELPTLAPGE